VESAVVRMVVPKRPPADVDDDTFLRAVVRAAFSKRRKTLLNNLKASSLFETRRETLPVILEDLGIDLTRRAETLSPEDFVRLSSALRRS